MKTIVLAAGAIAIAIAIGNASHLRGRRLQFHPKFGAAQRRAWRGVPQRTRGAQPEADQKRY